jgi:osmoprotectant transport system substrate-binding protein
MRGFRKLALGASVLALALSACSTGGSGATIKIGSDGFDEAKIVAEIYAQALEAKGFTVDRTGIGQGARAVTAASLESGAIDLKPEYLGGGLTYYGGTPDRHADENKMNLEAALKAKNLAFTVLDYTPGQDTNAFVIRKETADQLHLAKMSDVAPVQNQLKWALATDCPTNALCAAVLKSEYGLEPTNVIYLGACSGPMAEALLSKTVDVAELCSTGPEIVTNGWVVLEDDKQTQPAENIVPIVRNDLLAKIDKAKFTDALNAVSAKIDTATLAQLYRSVAVDHKDLKDVAATWLKSVGIVS